MSFLGYIGKSLGAGTAPIYNANVTAESDIKFREFRDKAPNRAEEEAMRMAGLRRAEQTAVDAEAERQRIMREGQGRVTTGYTPPGGALGVGAPLPEGAGEKIELQRVPARPAAGLSTAGAPAASATAPAAVTTAPDLSAIRNLPGFTEAPAVPPKPISTAAIAEIDRILAKSKGDDKRRVEGLKAYAKAGNRRPIEEIETELSQIQAELDAMPAASRTTREASRRDGISKRRNVLNTELRNERQLRGLEERFPESPLFTKVGSFPVGAQPTAAAAAAATPTPAQPTPAQPAPVSYPQTAAEIDPERDFEIYQIEPGRLSYDMTLVQSEYDRYVQRIQDAYRFTDMSDPKNVQATFLAVQPLEDALIQLDGQYAKLEVAQGIGMAKGGDTRYVNTVLTAALGYPIEVNPVLTAGGDIGYSININNVPMGDGEPLTPDQMQLSVMRMVDTQLDLALTEQELSRSAEIAKMYAEAQINRSLKQMEISGALYKEIYSQALQGGREQALERLKQSKPNATELAVMSDGNVVYFDETGTLFNLTTAEEEISGRRVQFPVTEPVTSRP